jgi:hypothetical protein
MRDNDYYRYMLHQKENASINIDTSNKCILECPGCQRNDLRNKDKIKNGNIMPISDFKKIVEYYDNINLCGQISDPVYYRHFNEFLDITKEYPTKTFRIATAAHQKNLQWYENAFNRHNNNVKWIFGLDGLPNTSFLYRIKQNSQLIFDAMILGAKLNKKISWQFIVFNYNKHQIEEAKKIANENNIRFILTISDRNRNSTGSPEEYKEKYKIKNTKRIVI